MKDTLIILQKINNHDTLNTSRKLDKKRKHSVVPKIECLPFCLIGHLIPKN